MLRQQCTEVVVSRHHNKVLIDRELDELLVLLAMQSQLANMNSMIPRNAKLLRHSD